MNIMPIDNIDDWEMRLKRQDAFWKNEIIDRPVVHMEIQKPNPQFPYPYKEYGSLEEHWMDAAFHAEFALARVMNTEYLGDALPCVFPNLGPDFFAVCFGGKLRFEETTSYIQSFLNDWNDIGKVTFSKDNIYFKKMEELYSTFLEAGRNRFYTGWPDLHPGADCIMGFRGPMNMNYDMVDDRDRVGSLLEYVTETFLNIYDHYYNKLKIAHQAVTGWPRIVSTRKWHVPSNDFSSMISPEMFDEMFLDGLIKEMRHMEANLYHLDGPDSLRHLDSLLSIKELNAIQWVYGAGNGRASDYIEVYKKIQAAGKGIQMFDVEIDELDVIIESLKPEGVWIRVLPRDKEEAEIVLKKIEKWGLKRT